MRDADRGAPLARTDVAAGGLPDIIAERLDVLFCGINPGLTAAATGHHFAGRGNRFWRTLHLAGFTPDEIAPENHRTILRYGCGLTVFVDHPTARADQLLPHEFAIAAVDFERKIIQYAPRFVAFLGKSAFAGLPASRDLVWGRQSKRIAQSTIWLLPNPSGRNRAFSLDRLVDAYRELSARQSGV